ncbi:FAD-binding oxidoreductase [Chthonobacter albigriseus]|uniref:FAD-binding oxidoreductase n=1 Tax=Chthonobacter albigriseus TaxID=1683161 RepID=UPI0015EF6E1F|nr:FAD-linked oxidase C-terminal domain-containing protein [Chthonobacter albigriseus]
MSAAAPLAPSAVEAAIADLKVLLGERCSTTQADREHHGRDESPHPLCPPDAVAYALSTDEVSAIVRICRRHGVPLIAFGAGTSLEGHTSALRGGVTVDLSRMNAVLSVRPEDLDVTVQCGVTRQQLNTHLRDTGLFFPVDPGAHATLGGMAATRASGTNAVRYGTMRENVLSLTVVLADGRVLKTANRARKSSAGYDLTRLFVGSEGTLGIITEVTLRLYGIPEAVSASICAFPDIEAAVDTAIACIQSGVPVARVELLDTLAMTAFNRWSKSDHPETPTLFFEFHGTPAGVAEQAAMVREIADGFGGSAFRFAEGAEARNRLWEARHNFHYAIQAMRPGASAYGTDTCVPISRLAECIRGVFEDTRNAPFPVSALGHVGDGNFHMTFLVDPANPEEVRLAEAYNERLVRHAIALGGTCTGEHGVGFGKSKFLREEHGDVALDVMRLLKQALDPEGILNPGKILPEG